MSIRNVTILILTAYVLSGCAETVAFFEKGQARKSNAFIYETPTPEKKAMFKKVLAQTAKSVKRDPKYRPIGLSSKEEKAWFATLTYRLWDRQITRRDFINEASLRYPQRVYEFVRIAETLQSI